MTQCSRRAPAGTIAPLTFTPRRHRHALLRRAAALRGRRAVPRRTRQRHPASSARTRPSSRTARGRRRRAYKAGDLVRVTLSFNLTKERRYVAVTDPLPAGFEAGRVLVRHDGARRCAQAAGRSGRSQQRLVLVVAARRLRSRRALRRSRPAVRDAAERRPPRVHATSSARRPPARSARRRRGQKRCTSRKCSGGRRRR